MTITDTAGARGGGATAAPAARSAPPDAAPGAPGALVTASVLLLAAMTIMANATIAPALPGLRAHFAGTPGIDTLTGLVLTLPSLSVVLSAGLFGLLADRVDRRRVLAFAALCYALGGASGLVAQTLPQMLVGRALLGIGVAGTMTLAMAYGADIWQGPARQRFMGLQGASMSAGGIVVMLAGGALSVLHWRGAFAVYMLVVPIALLALVVLGRWSRAARSPVAAGQPDAPFPWAVFAFVGTLAFLFMAVFYVMPTRLPFRLAEIGVTNPLLVGLVMAGFTAANIPGALNYGRLRRHLSAHTLFAAGFALMGLGLAVIAMADTLTGVVLGILVTGLGMGPSMPNYSVYLMDRVPPSARGRASGLLTTAFFLGQFASPFVSAPLVARFGLAGGFGVLGGLLVAVSLALAAGRRAGPDRRLA